MYERRYGAKAHETADLPVKEIAARIRKDIKTAKSAGDLPADLDVSVRYETASMMQAIRVTVKYRPDHWQPCDGFEVGSVTEYDDGTRVGAACRHPEHRHDPDFQHQVLSAEGRRVEALIESIHQSYNYDGSEIMVDYFDVRFYGTVEMQTAYSAEWELREKARQKAMRERRAARKAAA